MQSKHAFAQELNAFMKLRSSHNLNLQSVTLLQIAWRNRDGIKCNIVNRNYERKLLEFQRDDV